MKPEKRVCIAHLVALAKEVNSTIVLDYNRSKVIHFIDSKKGQVFQFMDIQRGSLLYGPLSAIYDSQTNSFFSIVITGNSFTGWDMDTSTMFSGTITGALVSIFDSQAGQFFLYGLQ